MIKVYGVPGWGSTISELMLILADIPYQFVDVSGFDHEGTSRELLKTLNPLCQIPTLALENDEIMTETAAIALMVLDRRPDLAPPVGRAERQQFQRLLVWLVANVYPTFTFADYPERWAPGFAPIFPDICYHLTHYKPAAADIPVASDNPAHYADAIRYNARTPLQGSLLPLTRLVWA